MSRFRSIAALALLFMMLLGGAGCWDRREINDLNVATMLGFDRATDNGKPRVLLTVLSLKTSFTGTPGMAGMGGGGGMQPTLSQVSSVEGETIADAVSNFCLRSPRQLYLGHTLAVVIGEDLARQGIEQVIEFADRNAELRYRIRVVVCDGTALEALQAQPTYEALHSTELIKEIEHDTDLASKILPANLLRVIYDLLTPGRDVALPRMHLFTPPEKGSPIRKGPAAGIVEIEQPGGESKGGGKGAVTGEDAGVGQPATPEKQAFSVDGSGVFQGDRLAGWLNKEESMGALFITGQAHGGAIPFAFRSSEKNASFVFHRASTKVKPVISPDGITFEVSIKGDGTLSENINAAIDVMKETDIQAAQRLIDDEAQHYCLEAVDRCQSLKSDAFGFGDLIHRTDPAFWKQIKDRWRDYYPAVKVVVKADFTIENTEIINEAVRPW